MRIKLFLSLLLSALLLGKLSLQSAQELLAARPTDGWEDLVTFKSESAITSAMSGLSSDEKTAFSAAIVIKSSYFEARMKIELDDLQARFGDPSGHLRLIGDLFAAVAAGAYENVSDAQHAMASRIERTYTPNPAAVPHFERLYQRYLHWAQQAEPLYAPPENAA